MRTRAIEIFLALLVLWTLALNASFGVDATPVSVGPALPQVTDPTRHYLFYLHGAWIEEHGLDGVHPDFGRYQYAEITHAFAERGFVVISEARKGRVEPTTYAQAVANQVNALVEKGVPADHITVVGHSKGGQIALLVASMLARPTVGFVIMAGCQQAGGGFRPGSEPSLETHAAAMQGRMLSLYDKSDRVAGTCEEAFAKAAAGRFEHKEIVLDTGRGHGLFFTPAPVWVDPVAAWSGMASPTTASDGKQ